MTFDTLLCGAGTKGSFHGLKDFCRLESHICLYSALDVFLTPQVKSLLQCCVPFANFHFGRTTITMVFLGPDKLSQWVAFASTWALTN